MGHRHNVRDWLAWLTTCCFREVEEADLELFFQPEHDPEAVRRSRFPPRIGTRAQTMFLRLEKIRPATR